MTDRKRQEGALRRSNDRLRLLGEAANYLLTHGEAREVVTDLFDKLSRQLGLEVYVAYFLTDEPPAAPGEPPGKALRLFASANLPQPLDERVKRLELGEGVCGVVATTGV